MEKSSNKTIVAAAVVAAVLLVGGFVAWKMMDNDADDSTSQSTNTTQTQTSATPASEALDTVEIVYTSSGFEKASYSVKQGGTVTVKNDSSRSLQFSSDDHPTHTKNSELNQSEVGAGQSQTFKVQKTGSWGIHDHLDAAKTTALVVL